MAAARAAAAGVAAAGEGKGEVWQGSALSSADEGHLPTKEDAQMPVLAGEAGESCVAADAGHRAQQRNRQHAHIDLTAGNACAEHAHIDLTAMVACAGLEGVRSAAGAGAAGGGA
eukprot:scaffold254084_cov17-Tisochrysis_lutea.AAC.1